jgi:hypothetical protein
MLVRLMRKLAPVLNGVDLSEFQVGDVLDLSKPMAWMLVAEGWADYEPSRPMSSLPHRPSRASVTDE